MTKRKKLLLGLGTVLALVIGAFIPKVFGQGQIYNPPVIPYSSLVTTIKNNLQVLGEAAFIFGPLDIVNGSYGGGNNAFFNPTGNISAQYNQVATGANTTPTTGHTYTLPFNSLAYNTEAVRIKIWGTTGADANTKTITLTFGGQTVWTSGAVVANGVPYYIEATIYQVSPGNQTVLVQGYFNAVPITSGQSRTTLTLPTTTTNEIIATTLTNGSAVASDIVENAMVVEAVP